MSMYVSPCRVIIGTQQSPTSTIQASHMHLVSHHGVCASRLAVSALLSFFSSFGLNSQENNDEWGPGDHYALFCSPHSPRRFRSHMNTTHSLLAAPGCDVWNILTLPTALLGNKHTSFYRAVSINILLKNFILCISFYYILCNIFLTTVTVM